MDSNSSLIKHPTIPVLDSSVEADDLQLVRDCRKRHQETETPLTTATPCRALLIPRPPQSTQVAAEINDEPVMHPQTTAYTLVWHVRAWTACALWIGLLGYFAAVALGAFVIDEWELQVGSSEGSGVMAGAMQEQADMTRAPGRLMATACLVSSILGAKAYR